MTRYHNQFQSLELSKVYIIRTVTCYGLLSALHSWFESSSFAVLAEQHATYIRFRPQTSQEGFKCIPHLKSSYTHSLVPADSSGAVFTCAFFQKMLFLLYKLRNAFLVTNDLSGADLVHADFCQT